MMLFKQGNWPKCSVFSLEEAHNITGNFEDLLSELQLYEQQEVDEDLLVKMNTVRMLLNSYFTGKPIGYE